MKPLCYLKVDAVLKYTVGPGETAYRQCEADDPGAIAVYGPTSIDKALYDQLGVLSGYYITRPPTPDSEFVNVCNGDLRKMVELLDEVLTKDTKKYFVGDNTMARVFTPAGLTNVSDMQAVFDAVEKALTPEETTPPQPQMIGIQMHRTRHKISDLAGWSDWSRWEEGLGKTDDPTFEIEIDNRLFYPEPQPATDLLVGDNQPRYTTKRMYDEVAKAKAFARCEALEESAALVESHSLQDEKKSYPKSGCRVCGKTIATGLGNACSFGTPPQKKEHSMGSEPVGYCVWITPTKLAACAKSAKGAFPVYASPDIDGSSFESCQRCQGNGEIVTDWERYMRAHEDENGNEAVAECPDCGGEGIIDTAPADQMVATKSESTVDQTAGSKFGSIFPRKSPEEVSRDPAYRKVQQELSGLRASIEGTETAHTDQVMGSVDWENPEDPVVKTFVGFDVEGYVEGYEFCGDEGYYSPNDQERALLVDALYGVIGDIHEDLRKLIPSSPAPAPQMVETKEPTKRQIEAAIDAYEKGSYLNDEQVLVSVIAIIRAALSAEVEG